jgi:prophage regulatory protein
MAENIKFGKIIAATVKGRRRKLPEDLGGWVASIEVASTARAKVESNLLSLKEVVAVTSLSRSSIYALVSHGAFPRPVSLTPRRVAWRSTDVNAWMQTRMSAAR